METTLFFVETFWNPLTLDVDRGFQDRRFCQIIWQIFTHLQGRTKKFVKNCPRWGLNRGPPDQHGNALSTEPSQHSVASLNLHGHALLILEMTKVQHVKWYTKQNSVSRALEWWPSGPGFNSHWDKFWQNLFWTFLSMLSGFGRNRRIIEKLEWLGINVVPHYVMFSLFPFAGNMFFSNFQKLCCLWQKRSDGTYYICILLEFNRSF